MAAAARLGEEKKLFRKDRYVMGCMNRGTAVKGMVVALNRRPNLTGLTHDVQHQSSMSPVHSLMPTFALGAPRRRCAYDTGYMDLPSNAAPPG